MKLGDLLKNRTEIPLGGARYNTRKYINDNPVAFQRGL